LAKQATVVASNDVAVAVEIRMVQIVGENLAVSCFSLMGISFEYGRRIQ